MKLKNYLIKSLKFSLIIIYSFASLPYLRQSSEKYLKIYGKKFAHLGICKPNGGMTLEAQKQ